MAYRRRRFKGGSGLGRKFWLPAPIKNVFGHWWYIYGGNWHYSEAGKGKNSQNTHDPETF